MPDHPFYVDQHVRLHAATDQFMMGVRSAYVYSIGRKWITIQHPESGRKFKFSFAFAKSYFLQQDGNPF